MFLALTRKERSRAASHRVKLVLPLLIFVCAPTLAHAGDGSEAPTAAVTTLNVSTPTELRAALEGQAANIAITANLSFSESSWPDPPVTVARPVTILSRCLARLDFGQSARVLINVTDSGLVTLHFPPPATWVFSAPPGTSFWADAAAQPPPDPAAGAPRQPPASAAADDQPPGGPVLASVRDGSPLQLARPDMYLLRLAGPRYYMHASYAALDLRSCWGRGAEGGREDMDQLFCT